tara:strand:- start:475 stop:1053 length:579 start_codon:yes stop_codon:yes gene_type:complete
MSGFKLPGFGGKKTNIKGDMDRKYGLGDYARDGKKFEERMKPGESKFNYDVRMRKRATKLAKNEYTAKEKQLHNELSSLDQDVPMWNEPGYVQGVHGNLTPEPPNPNDKRDQSQVQNFGITPGMTFGQAFAQAGRLGAKAGQSTFFWTNPETQEEKTFLYDFEKKEEKKQDATDIDMDNIPDYIQGTTRYHK